MKRNYNQAIMSLKGTEFMFGGDFMEQLYDILKKNHFKYSGKCKEIYEKRYILFYQSITTITQAISKEVNSIEIMSNITKYVMMCFANCENEQTMSQNIIDIIDNKLCSVEKKNQIKDILIDFINGMNTAIIKA